MYRAEKKRKEEHKSARERKRERERETKERKIGLLTQSTCTMVKG